MAKLYVKLPVEVEAMQWTGDNLEEMREFCGRTLDSTGEHSIEVFNPAGTYLVFFKGDGHDVEEPTADLWVAANKQWLPLVTGEWVIHDSKGFYPCKEDVFTETYAEVQNPPTADCGRLYEHREHDFAPYPYAKPRSCSGKLH